MAGKWTNGSPVIAGGEGSLVITEEGKQITLANVSSVNADIEHEKSQIQPVGHRIDLHKVTGGEGTGSMTVYYVSSRFGHYMEMYKDRGVSPYFDMIITNDDPASTAKRQIVTLYGVNLDSTTLALLDGSRTELTVDIDFTFEDYSITEAFCPDVDAEYIADYTTDDMSVLLNLPVCVQYNSSTSQYVAQIKGDDSSVAGCKRYYFVGDTDAMPTITGTRKAVIGTGDNAKTTLRVGQNDTVELTAWPAGGVVTLSATGDDVKAKDQSIMVVDAQTSDGHVIAYGQTQLTPIKNVYMAEATPVHHGGWTVTIPQSAAVATPVVAAKPAASK